MSVENIKYDKNTIERESNKISIPFSAVKKYYDIDKIFETNNIYIILRKFFNKTSENLHQKNGIKTTSEILREEIFEGKTLSSAIIQELKKELKEKKLTLKDISEIGVRKGGTLVFKLKNQEEIYFNLNAKELNQLVVKQELQDAKKEVEKSISSYVIGGTIFTLTLLPVAKYEWEKRGKKASKFLLKKIVLEQKGKKIALDLNEKIKGYLKEKDILKIVQKNGLDYNPKTGTWEFKNPVEKIKASLFKQSLANMTYKDFKKNLEKAGIKDIPTEKDFEKIKQEASKFIDDVLEESKKTKTKFGKVLESEIWKSLKNSINLEKIGEKSMHYALLPIFFQEIHKHTGSTQSYIEGGTEYIGFTGLAWLTGQALARAGTKVPFLRHPLVMLIGSLALGTLGTMIGKHELEEYDKELLELIPNKDIEDGKKTTDDHWISLGVVYDLLDKINFDFTENGFWMGIDMTNNINASTNPEFYLAKRFSGVKHWNKELEEYKEKTVQKIDELLKKDFRYSDILEEKDDLIEGLTNIIVDKSILKKETIVDRKKGGNIEKKKEIKKAKSAANLIIAYLQENLPKDIYCGDEEKYKEFEKKFELFLKSFLKDKEKIKLVSMKFKKLAEERFIENIEKITGIKKDIIQTYIGSSGKEKIFMNDIQKNTLKRLTDLLYYEYPRYKEKKSEKYLSFVKNKASLIIEENRIDKNYIKTYKENLENKKGFLELAFKGKLTTDINDDDGKYLVMTNKMTSYVPVEKANGEIGEEKFEENIDDVLYINSLSKKDRDFIKNRIYKPILEGKDISKGSVGKHFVEPRFKELIQNPQFYNFYKRILTLAKQNFFIQNIEKYGDAVEWDEENSWLSHPINNFKKKVLDVL